MRESIEEALSGALELASRAGRPRGLALAISGGSDSIALLAAAAALAPTEPLLRQALVLHVNHGLRPDSAAAGRLVAKTADALGLRHRVLVVAERPPARGSIEAWARAQRYALLEEAMREDDREILLTAHHADDQAETVALRLMRGSNALALGGMKLARPLAGDLRIVRPFLDLDREALDRYRREAGLEIADDATNRRLRHRRNLLRHLALPGEPGLARERLLALAARAGDLDVRLSSWAEHRLERFGARRRHDQTCRTIEVEAEIVAGLPAPALGAILRALLARIGRPEVRVSSAIVRGAARGDRVLELSRDLHLEFANSRLVLRQRMATGTRPSPRVVALDAGAIELDTGERFDLRRVDRCVLAVIEAAPMRQVLPIAALRGRLELRAATPGERMQGFGMSGKKAVSEYYREAGIAAALRDRRPLLADDEGVLWLPGIRAAERCRVRNEDDELLLIEWRDRRGTN